MGFLSGTKRTGSVRLSGAVLAIALASVLTACQSATPVRPKVAAIAGPTVPTPPEATQPAVPAVPAAVIFSPSAALFSSIVSVLS